MGVPEGEYREKKGGKKRKNIGRNNGQKVPKFHERYGPTNPGISMNFK